MKKNKATYVTDLTYEILTNRDLLNDWAKNSIDMKFLELSPEILSDVDLLFSWDCDNVLKLKLSGILSKGQDFKLKSGIVIEIDDAYIFSITKYKYNVKVLIEAKANEDIKIAELLSEGYSPQQIKEDMRMRKMQSFLNVVQKSKNVPPENQEHLFGKMLPEAIKQLKKVNEQFYKQKFDDFTTLPIEDVSLHNKPEVTLSKNEIKTPIFNRNNWNQKCFDLFNYLIDNYEKKGKIKYINIFYFFKNEITNTDYAFNHTIDSYKIFITEKYKVKLNTFRTAEADFNDKVIPILKNFEQDFRELS